MANQINWAIINKTVANMDEETLRNTINYEVSTCKRKTIIVRLHQRYVMLKAKREREELLKGNLL